MGLTGAPECFHTLVNDTIRRYLSNFVLFCLEDVPDYSKEKRKHFEHLSTVFEKLREPKLYRKTSKCEFLKSQIQYFGHEIT